MSDWADNQVEEWDNQTREASGRVQNARKYGDAYGADQARVQTSAENANRWRRVRSQQAVSDGAYTRRWPKRRSTR